MPNMKDERIAVRLSRATKDKLTRAAAADKRTLSSLLEKIIDEWLAARPAPAGRSQRSATAARSQAAA